MDPRVLLRGVLAKVGADNAVPVVVYTGGRGPHDRHLSDPPFLRSHFWPGAEANDARVESPYQGAVKVTQVAGGDQDSHAAFAGPLFGSTQRPLGVVLGSPDGQSANVLSLTHELTHVKDPALGQRDLEQTPYGKYEPEIPAVVAETAHSLSTGIRPPQDAPGAPWIYDHIKKHGPQLHPGMSSVERENELSRWDKDLRDPHSALGMKYQDWLKSESKNGSGPAFTKAMHQDIAAHPEDYRTNWYDLIPKPLLVGAAATAAAAVLIYWLHHKKQKARARGAHPGSDQVAPA